MTPILAIAIGGLFAAAFYNLARQSIVALAFGLMLLGHASNLLVFFINGLVRNKAPLISPDATQPPVGFADPLSQALILTAVVINFGMVAFALVLLHRTRRVAKTDDVDELRSSE